MPDTFDREKMIAKMQRDKFAHETLGAEIVDVRPGWAKTCLVIEEKHLNAVGIAQGGALFTLADYAFAIGSNCGDDEVVAIEVSMSFMKPCRLGTKIFAQAKEISRSRSLVSYDIPVTNENGELLAKFYGRGFVRIPKSV